MPDDVNRANVTIDLRDIYGQTITDQVEISFYNKTLESLKQKFTLNLKGFPIELSGIPAFPTGLAQVHITPARYRYKSVFINVFGDEPNLIKEDLFVDPDKARPKSIDFQDLSAKSYGANLLKILTSSGITQPIWDNVNKRNRATILNLSAKMSRETTKDKQPLIEQVNTFDQSWFDVKHQARLLATVNGDLIKKLRKFPEKFNVVSGSLHDFPAPWTPVDDAGSFKTNDAAGNIQLTFATNANGDFIADIDLDDHSGIKHAADVLKHTISNKDTDPYDIHEILRYFQNLDPEYPLL